MDLSATELDQEVGELGVVEVTTIVSNNSISIKGAITPDVCHLPLFGWTFHRLCCGVVVVTVYRSVKESQKSK